ncbi:MAG: hypothetical protein R3C44_16105 [Chloroflexota bacterium]
MTTLRSAGERAFGGVEHMVRRGLIATRYAEEGILCKKPTKRFVRFAPPLVITKRDQIDLGNGTN